MISLPAAASSIRRDKWVFAKWMLTVDLVVRLLPELSLVQSIGAGKATLFQAKVPSGGDENGAALERSGTLLMTMG